MQLTRVLGGVALGLLAGVILTRIVLLDPSARIWIINATWFLVWGGIFALGIIVAVAVPRRFEAPVAVLSVMAGSLGMVFWLAAYEGTAAISLADAGTVSYVAMSFLISGLGLGLVAGIGAWVVAGIRRRAEENEGHRLGGASGYRYDPYDHHRR